MKSSQFYLLFTQMLFTVWLPSQTKAQSTLSSFPLQQVTLLPGVFKDAQITDMKYILALDPDRLLAPYLTEAGLTPKKPNYGNWENTGLDGHIGGHYLSALSFMYASTNNSELNMRLDYMLEQLGLCQDKIGSGYLGGTPGGTAMWKEITAGKIESDTFMLNKKWVPLYNIHKLFAGLRDAYLVGGKTKAKNILIRLTDYIDNVSQGLTDEQIQTMLFSEHGALNEVFADVAFITGQEKYLKLAQRFSHKLLLNQLIQGQDKLDGLHANMQIPKAVGYQRISEVGAEANYGKAARFFWQTVVTNRSVVIGGNSVREHFNPSNNFNRMITDVAGPETCNTYNMLKLTRHLFEAEGKLEYLNYYERALYNHILSSQHPTRGGFVYYTPMRPRHYRVYSQPGVTMWCCVGSGMENHGKYGELIYSYRGNDIFVNLLIPSRIDWKTKGLVLSQQTRFPDEDRTEIIIESARKGRFSINIRYPIWVEKNRLSVKVNSAKIDLNATPNSYIEIKREWKKGDKIEVHFPMQITVEELPGSSNYIAFMHGPIVLAAKTDTTDLDNLIGDSNQWGGYRARGPLYSFDSLLVLKPKGAKIETLVKPVSGKSQTFIAPDIIISERFKNLELIPFYKLHDARYVIYWKQSDE